jgi:hypothetical protein
VKIKIIIVIFPLMFVTNNNYEGTKNENIVVKDNNDEHTNYNDSIKQQDSTA